MAKTSTNITDICVTIFSLLTFVLDVATGKFWVLFLVSLSLYVYTLNGLFRHLINGVELSYLSSKLFFVSWVNPLTQHTLLLGPTYFPVQFQPFLERKIGCMVQQDFLLGEFRHLELLHD